MQRYGLAMIKCAMNCNQEIVVPENNNISDFIRDNGWDIFMGQFFCPTHRPDSESW